MTFQIAAIFLYSAKGARRDVTFNRGGLSVITGESGTGKSAIISIVDYCLGRSEFTVPEGAIRDNVAWYGIHLIVSDGTEIIVAKPAPKKNANSQSQCFLSVGPSLEPPPYDELAVNSNDEALERHLTRQLGMSPNLHEPGVGASRAPLAANISHTKFYLFQDQGLVADRDMLFFRQSEQFLPQAMKDTLPYLMGAVEESTLFWLQELRELRKRHRAAERELREIAAVSGSQPEMARILLSEAVQAGLTGDEALSLPAGSVRARLAELLPWTPDLPVEGGGREVELRAQLRSLRAELEDVVARIESAESFTGHASAYQEELGRQRARLESINALPTGDANSCPFCGAAHAIRPATSEDLATRLHVLRSQLSEVEEQRPRLLEYVSELEGRRTDLGQRIRGMKQELAALSTENARAERLNDQNMRAARVLGRVSLYLESEPEQDLTVELTRRIADIETQIEILVRQLEESDTSGLLKSYLNRIGLDMTALASRLKFEHHKFPLRFEIDSLTVVADRPSRPMKMQRMGSGQNWLVCHIACLLALHRHFRAHERPVPSFLILDQPSQVYFPTEGGGSYRNLGGSAKATERSGGDLQSVRKLFALLSEVIDECSGEMQIIVLEHANLNDKRFQDALIEEPWTVGGLALVPQEWI